MNRTKRRLGRKGILLAVALTALLAAGCGGKRSLLRLLRQRHPLRRRQGQGLSRELQPRNSQIPWRR